MNVREALTATLKADATLVAMLAHPSAVYHRRAPGESGTPLIIVDSQSPSRRRWVFSGRGGSLEDETWTVKAVSLGRDAAAAEAVAARVDTVLTDAPLTVDGRVTLYVRRELDIDFGVDEGAYTWHHCGGVYRTVTERT